MMERQLEPPSTPATLVLSGVGFEVAQLPTEEATMFVNAAMATVLPASDLERAKKWYADTLGIDSGVENEYGVVLYDLGGSTFLLYQSEYAGTNQATAAGFELEDFDEAIEMLRSKGVSFEHVDMGPMGSTVDGVISSPDGSQKVAWFKDSEGNILTVSTPE